MKRTKNKIKKGGSGSMKTQLAKARASKNKHKRGVNEATKRDARSLQLKGLALAGMSAMAPVAETALATHSHMAQPMSTYNPVTGVHENLGLHSVSGNSVAPASMNFVSVPRARSNFVSVPHAVVRHVRNSSSRVTHRSNRGKASKTSHNNGRYNVSPNMGVQKNNAGNTLEDFLQELSESHPPVSSGSSFLPGAAAFGVNQNIELGLAKCKPSTFEEGDYVRTLVVPGPVTGSFLGSMSIEKHTSLVKVDDSGMPIGCSFGFYPEKFRKGVGFSGDGYVVSPDPLIRKAEEWKVAIKESPPILIDSATAARLNSALSGDIRQNLAGKSKKHIGNLLRFTKTYNLFTFNCNHFAREMLGRDVVEGSLRGVHVSNKGKKVLTERERGRREANELGKQRAQQIQNIARKRAEELAYSKTWSGMASSAVKGFTNGLWQSRNPDNIHQQSYNAFS